LHRTKEAFMKRLIAGLTAALALSLVGAARADDTSTTKDKTTEKSQKKTTKDPKSAGSATDSSGYTKPDTATDRATLPPDTTDKDKMLKEDKAAPTPAPTR
jgi:hypothetical protein